MNIHSDIQTIQKKGNKINQHVSMFDSTINSKPGEHKKVETNRQTF